MIAALYVQTGGAYFGLPDVDPWDEPRDARLYAGPHPAVAHPPCQRWGRYWGGGPMLHGTPRQKIKGDDAGCFAAALAAVRRWGGVIEHPEASAAWAAHGLLAPPKYGGWVTAGDWRGWTCCVEQGHYGHRARKATWLYVCGTKDLPELIWGPSEAKMKIDEGFHSTAARWAAPRTERSARMAARERAATPPAFRDALLDLARRCAR